MKPTNEVYPRAPLIEAVFEIRFPGEPAIECHRDEVYNAIRDRFPIVNVPKIKTGDAPALGPYRFLSKDQKKIVSVSMNLFSFISKSYVGFQNFKNEALGLMRPFVDRFGLNALRRTGLRYTNLMGFVHEDGGIPVERFLNLSITLPRLLPNTFHDLQLAFASKVGNGALTTRIGRVVSEDKTSENLLLDFDYAKEQMELQAVKIEQYLDESHAETKKFFESLITDDYRKFMRGEVLE